METFNSYTLVDLSTIKTPKINSEKDLETEISKICDLIKDNCNLLSYFKLFKRES